MNEEYQPPKTNPVENHNMPEQRSSAWIYVCIAAAIASVMYRVIVIQRLEQTSLLFIGIPLVLSIMLTNTPKPRSATGSIMKSITLMLLMFGILLFEGLICILMAAPLAYLVGAIIGYVSDRNGSSRMNKMNCSVITVLAIMSMEGITEALSFDREESVVVTRTVDFQTDQALSMLADQPEFTLSGLPTFLKLGFPLPTEVAGQGIALGDRRTIHFAGGEGEPGDLIVEVTEASNNKIVFSLVEDGSHISHWLTWKTITWEINPTDDGKSEVTITLNYTRELDPAWYFKPIERYGVKKAGEYFIDSVYTQ